MVSSLFCKRATDKSRFISLQRNRQDSVTQHLCIRYETKTLLVWLGLVYTRLWLGWQHIFIDSPWESYGVQERKQFPEWQEVGQTRLNVSWASPPLPSPPPLSPFSSLLTSPYLNSPPLPFFPFSSPPFPFSPTFLLFSFFFKLIDGGRTYQLRLPRERRGTLEQETL